MNTQSDIVLSRLISAVEEAFYGPKRDFLTVKSVREQVEVDLGLVRGFLRTGDWKKVSKVTIETRVKQLLKAEEQGIDSLSQTSKPVHHNEDPLERHTKRPLKCANPSRKRIKTSISTQSEEKSFNEIEEAHEASDSQDNNVTRECATKPGFTLKTSVNSVRRSNINSENDEIAIKERPSLLAPINNADFEEKNVIVNKPSKKVNHSPTFSKLQSENEASANNQISIPTRITATAKEKDGIILKPVEPKETIDSDISSVIDEPNNTRKKKQAGNKKGQVHRAKRNYRQENSVSSDEAKMKTLQTQLRKCGVRTMWHLELKTFGDDSRAKIRHLRKALKDVGMIGRFSEAKAKEIKESRELMADLEAVKEGEKKWGLGNVNGDFVENGKRENSDIFIGEACLPKNIKGPNLRNKTLRNNSNVSKNSRTLTALDWLENEEDSE